MPEAKGGVWIGLDFGTTHSSVAIWDSTRGHPKWIRLRHLALPEGHKPGRLVPSQAILVRRSLFYEENVATQRLDHDKTVGSSGTAAAAASTSDILVILGASAREKVQQAWSIKESSPYDPAGVAAARVPSLKRLFATATETDENCVNLTPLGPSSDQENTCSVAAEILVQCLFRALRVAANEYIRTQQFKKRLCIPGDGGECLHVVVGVPAQYSRHQRDRICSVAQKAGFHSCFTVTESTAAALAYGIGVATQKNHILVFDMGGGTTDVTICEWKDEKFHVRVTQGDGELGGDNMDQALANYVQQSLQISHLPLHRSQSLLSQCQFVKERLCTAEDATIEERITFQGQSLSISLSDLNTSIASIVQRARDVVITALKRFGTDKVDEVILIGGATRVPAIRAMLQSIFPQQELCQSVNAMSAVAVGAAIQAAKLSQKIPLHELKSALMLDSNPHAIGVLTPHEHFVEILPKDMSLPARGYATFELASVDQAGVTIKAVEAIDEPGKQSTTQEDQQYVVIGEFTFLLHRLAKNQIVPLKQRSIDVGMILNENGEFIVSIFDPNDPEHIRKREAYRQAQTQGDARSLNYNITVEQPITKEQIILVILCILLFGAYVWTKLAFPDEVLPGSLSHETISGTEI